MFLISKTTSTSSSVTFSSIPSDYADLCLFISARDTRNSAMADVALAYNSGTVQDRTINGSTGSISVTNNLNGGNSITVGGPMPANNATASTFSGIWIYLPQYRSTTSKAALGWGLGTNNSSTSNSMYIYSWGSWFSLSSAATSLTLSASSTFASGSTFCLYGIKNS